MTELEQYFIFRCEKGLKQRGLSHLPEYRERMKYETSVIIKMKYCAYFLIVSDYINWAINNGIFVSPGRGSGSGSLAVYCLYITHIDPIKYNLVFERFLNPDRVSMPDIDTDFDDLDRYKVINYLKDKYGRDCVSGIGTFGVLHSKTAIRDVCRTLNFPYQIGDKLAKLTLDPISGKPQTLQTCYEKVPELASYHEQEDSPESIVLKWADKVEGRIRSYGQHASGFIVASEPIAKSIPLYVNSDGEPTTQFEMNTVEEVGLIKFDLLGLKTLSTIKTCIKLIKKYHKTTIDPLKIPVDDEATYKLLQEGNVVGVFQLEGSSGFQDLIIKIKPKCLEDIGFSVAVYRPGPLGSDALQHYLKVRAGLAKPKYKVPQLEPILKSTDGFLVYQEQVIEIFKQLGGFTLAESDLARRAVGKKIKEKLDALKPKYIEGCKSNGIKQEDAEAIFTDIEFFSAYGFNKSHAISYGYITYQTAYLKTHYPVEWMCSCLITDYGDTDKIIRYISHCKEQGIEILPPDINRSDFNFSIEDNKIRFGLSAIKNLGKSVEEIIHIRKNSGAFSSLKDFIDVTGGKGLNSRKLECLIYAGAFDNIPIEQGGYPYQDRQMMLNTLTEMFNYRDEYERYSKKLETYNKRMEVYKTRMEEIEAYEQLENKKGIKRPGRLKLPEKPPEPQSLKEVNYSPLPIGEKLNKEKELLGFFVSGHPLDNITQTAHYTIQKIQEDASTSMLKNKRQIQLVAIPSAIKTITTKRNKQRMAYIVLEDKTGTIETTVLPNVYKNYFDGVNSDIINIQTPALYIADTDITESDVGQVVKLMIKEVIPIKQREAMDICVSSKDIIDICNKIKESIGDNLRINLSVELNKCKAILGSFNVNKDKFKSLYNEKKEQ